MTSGTLIPSLVLSMMTISSTHSFVQFDLPDSSSAEDVRDPFKENGYMFDKRGYIRNAKCPPKLNPFLCKKLLNSWMTHMSKRAPEISNSDYSQTGSSAGVGCSGDMNSVQCVRLMNLWFKHIDDHKFKRGTSGSTDFSGISGFRHLLDRLDHKHEIRSGSRVSQYYTGQGKITDDKVEGRWRIKIDIWPETVE